MQRYDDNLTIKQSKTAFDLDSAAETLDLRNVRYVSTTDHLNCPVCQQPFFQPMTTLCGHTFCKECINECLNLGSTSLDGKKKGFCPLDRTQIDPNDIHDLFPTPLIVTNMVDELKVYCLNSERGCIWSGHRWEVENHVRNLCKYTGVLCNGIRLMDDNPHPEKLDESHEEKGDTKSDLMKRCCLLVERRFVDPNVDECVHRVFDCQICGTEITKITEEDHLDKECELNYSTCGLCQNDMIPRHSLEKHRENCKKSGRLLCPAHDIGCEWTGNNEPSLEIHLQKGNCSFNQLLPHFASLKARISEVESENKYLQGQIHHILDSIIQGKVTNLGYSEPLEEIGTFRKALSRLQDQDRLLHLDYEIERLRCELDEKINPFIERETNNISEHQNLITGLVSDNFMIKDEMNLQRALISSLRKQVQFFSFRNRQQQAAGISLVQAVDTDDLVGMLSRSSSEERLNLKL